MDHTSINPVALLTGASSGIGLELARQFAQHQFDIIAISAGDRIHDVPGELRQYDANAAGRFSGA